MILPFFRKKTDPEPVFAVYRAIVAQSRQPIFYAQWAVPDTVTGRFDMISLHLVLLFRRMRNEGKEASEFSQALFDLFFRDMDSSLREMGVSDIGVPKKVQKMGGLFYGLLASVNDAMDKSDMQALEAAVARNVYDGVQSDASSRLTAYLVSASGRLEQQPAAAITAGRIDFGAIT